MHQYRFYIRSLLLFVALVYVLATWAELLDAGRGQDGDVHLAGTAKPARAIMSAATASAHGITTEATISTDAGAITVPVELAEVADDTVWLPTNAAGCAVRRDLGASTGTVVSLAVDDGTPVETATSAGSEK